LAVAVPAHALAALVVSLSRRPVIFNRPAFLGVAMNCPACGSPVTLEFGSDWPLSTSLSDAILTAEEDEQIEVTRDCWDCGWHETRALRVASIDTTAGDETAVERAALIDEITDELAAIESVDTLEETLAAIRQQRATDPARTATDDATE
jgi:hypothetical protein